MPDPTALTSMWETSRMTRFYKARPGQTDPPVITAPPVREARLGRQLG